MTVELFSSQESVLSLPYIRYSIRYMLTYQRSLDQSLRYELFGNSPVYDSESGVFIYYFFYFHIFPYISKYL